MKLDILAIGAHPDDVEFGCGGTLLKLASEGKSVGIIDLTQGEMGTRGTIETRYEEAANAAKLLGLKARENLKMKDGFLVNSEEYQLRIVQMIRKYRPEIVFCNAWEDRHPDHAKGSKLVSDACFLAGLRKLETEYNGEKQEAWRPKHVFHYIQWKHITPDFVVDITGFMEAKVNAVLAYSSQFYDSNSNEPTTPISDRNFLDSVTYRARDLGRLIGTDFAEGFTCERVVAVETLFNLK